VAPNPRLSLVREGIELAKKERIDLVLAVGGGSAIDSAKAIALGTLSDLDIWDFYMGKAKVERALPVGVVLTLPATGSETSSGTVITNEEEQLKHSVDHDILRPAFAIMDPEYTMSLPDNQTFAGAMDILSHVFERYFTNTPNVDLTDELSEGTMRNVIKNTYILKKDPKNYEARAEIMLAGTIAHNGLLGLGRDDDWSSHRIAHQLSALYGTTHGDSLAIIFPAWMKYVYRTNPERFSRFATKVFGVSDAGKSAEMVALEGISRFEEFLTKIGLPKTFSEGGIPDDDLELMAGKAVLMGPIGAFKVLEKEDVLKIYKLAL
jgi:alcohol dehydrogenase YqhD (iron-dependent ADH family)